MPSPQHIDEVNAAIAKGRLKIAFKKLKDLFPLLEAYQMADDHCKHLQNRFLLLSGEFHFNDEKELLKLSEEAFTDVNRNRITSALIEMTTEIGEIINKSEVSNNGNGQTGAPIVSPQKKGVIEITLHDRDLASFSAEEREHFFNAIAELVKMEKEGIVIKSIKSGSVKITLELDEEKAIELERLIEGGGLDKWGTVSVKRIIHEIDPKVLAVLERRGIGFEMEDGRLVLSGVDLSKVNLSKADLRLVDLSGADLSGANLWRTNLWGADLTGVDLRGADLTEANLKVADLRVADLTRANLNGTKLWLADLAGADLTGADLTGADLAKAIFHTSQKNHLDEIGIDTTVINFIDDENTLEEKGVEINV